MAYAHLEQLIDGWGIPIEKYPAYSTARAENCRQAERAYMNHMDEVGNAKLPTYTKALRTMQAVLREGYGFDFNHPQNYMFKGGKEPAFGFIDLQGPGQPGELTSDHISGFARQIWGHGDPPMQVQVVTPEAQERWLAPY